MTVGYKSVGWNRQKKIYDLLLLSGTLVYLAVFVAAGLVLRPNGTAETLLIRGLGTAALLSLHLVLAIGPLCRISPRFLPLLYNRRHFGVATFLLGLAHGGFSLVQFHALGDQNPFVSVLTANPRWDSVSQFPFQPLGLAALGILFLMAATSHDFWLANLTAPVWKAIHMAVYLAYALVVLHVGLGVLQAETDPLLSGVLFAGLGVLLGLQLVAALRERALDRRALPKPTGGFVDVCDVGELPEKGAKIVSLAGERVAIFRYDGKVSAISNVCQHQNGPLGEGRIVNGCVVCPWHGYEYNPKDGASPAPFTEKVPTFRVQVSDNRVWVDPLPNPPGTPVEPASVDGPGFSSGPDHFYVGYRPETSPPVARSVRKVAAALFGLAVALPLILVSAEGRFSDAVFEYGNVQEFEGVASAEPYPRLTVGSEGGARSHLLVAFGKKGAQDELAGQDGKRVKASGQLIYRDNTWMIELDGDLQSVSGTAEQAGAGASLGRHALVGEIVDSKCYLGVMKPGRGKPHRSCAARCISGGVPPIFVVTDRQGNGGHLLLVGEDGRQLHQEVLSMVAEPLAVEGEVVRTAGGLTLLAEPGRFERLGVAGK